MNKAEVTISFKDYKNDKISKIDLDLLDDIILSAEVVKDRYGQPGICLTMTDDVTENVEVKGFLDMPKLQSLIKVLTTIYKQSNSQKEEGCRKRK